MLIFLVADIDSPRDLLLRILGKRQRRGGLVGDDQRLEIELVDVVKALFGVVMGKA